MKPSLFGPFNSVLDEAGHVVLALIFAAVFFHYGLALVQAAVVCFIGAFLIDIDHLLNTFICKSVLKVPNFKGGILHCEKGYVPHIFHGIDVAVILGIIVALNFGWFIGSAIFVSLLAHLLWDFMVYPFKVSVLFLAARASKAFRIGERDYFKGKIFDLDTLVY